MGVLNNGLLNTFFLKAPKYVKIGAFQIMLFSLVLTPVSLLVKCILEFYWLYIAIHFFLASDHIVVKLVNIPPFYR